MTNAMIMVVEFYRGGEGRLCGWIATPPHRRPFQGSTMAAGRDLPHDLTQFTIERALDISDGFWGLLAHGGSFASVPGRRPTSPGRALVRAHHAALVAVEQIINSHYQAWKQGQATPLKPALDAMYARWLALAGGERLALEWAVHPLPGAVARSKSHRPESVPPARRERRACDSSYVTVRNVRRGCGTQFCHMRFRRFTPLVFVVAQACQFQALSGPRDATAFVGVAFGFAGSASDAFLTVGDQDTIRAQAYTAGWPSGLKYDSSNEPRRFTYSSSDPAVASVNLDGVVTALSPGTTILRATVDGVTGTLPLTVSPPASVLRAEPDSVATHVGQTFAISIVAADEKGQSVPGVIFEVGVDTTYWAVTSVPVEGTWSLATPAVLHLTARMVGSVHLTVTTLRENSRARLTASVPIVVTAP